MTVIDLDANATTSLLPEAWEAMRPVMLEESGNPSSAHSLGRKARRYLDESREIIAGCLDAKSDVIILTSGATEANNLALFGLAGDPPGHLITSPIEHPCVVEPFKQLESRGFEVGRVSVDRNCRFEKNIVLSAMRPDTRLVSLMLANHETGAVQPIGDIATSLPKTVIMHTDAAQAVGKIPVSFRSLGVTALTASAHKFGGPKGVGFLILKSGTKLKPLQFGGHQQKGFRPGTEPVALAVGMAAALSHAVRELENTRRQLFERREQLWNRLKNEANAVLNGPNIDDRESLPNTLNVSFPGCRADLLLMALDLAGVACSTGSACSSGSLLPSPVLTAMGLPEELLRSAIRFSLSPKHRESDIQDAGDRIVAAVKRVKESEN